MELPLFPQAHIHAATGDQSVFGVWDGKAPPLF